MFPPSHASMESVLNVFLSIFFSLIMLDCRQVWELIGASLGLSPSGHFPPYVC